MNQNSSNLGITVLSTLAIGVVGAGITFYNYKDCLFDGATENKDEVLCIKNGDGIDEDEAIVDINSGHKLIKKDKKKRKLKELKCVKR